MKSDHKNIKLYSEFNVKPVKKKKQSGLCHVRHKVLHQHSGPHVSNPVMSCRWKGSYKSRKDDINVWIIIFILRLNTVGLKLTMFLKNRKKKIETNTSHAGQASSPHQHWHLDFVGYISLKRKVNQDFSSPWGWCQVGQKYEIPYLLALSFRTLSAIQFSIAG